MTEKSETRIAFYLPSFERGGVERLVVNLSRELIKRNVIVDVLIAVADRPMLDQVPDGTNVVRLKSNRRVDRLLDRVLPKHVARATATLPSYIRYLKQSTPTLLVSMQMSPFAIIGGVIAATDTIIAARESNTPSAATANPPHLIGRLAPFAKRVTYSLADHVIAVSADARDDIAESLNVPREKLKVIYNPTYNDQLLRDAQKPIEHPWYNDENTVVVSVGRFSDQKDFETLIQAVARSDNEPHLVLVGDGKNRTRLENLSRELGVDQRVDFVGYQDNPFPYMANANLFVLSSRYEGLPNVVIEALGVGTPVVATDCPSGPREILLDGEGGYLVPVGDADRMAQAIDRALTEKKETGTRLERAQEALTRFTPENAAAAYLDLVG